MGGNPWQGVSEGGTPFMGGSFPPGESRGGLGRGMDLESPSSAVRCAAMCNRAVRRFFALAPVVAGAAPTGCEHPCFMAFGRQRTITEKWLSEPISARQAPRF